VIPAKRGKKTWCVHGVRAEMRRAFPQRIYRRRALIESLFSSVKRKTFGPCTGSIPAHANAPSSLARMSFNLYRLKHRRLFLRMSTEPNLSHKLLLGGHGFSLPKRLEKRALAP